MSEPLVTVITVTYNSAKYVRDAIESVLAQSYTNIEYIISDDCSTDNTWEIINEYTDTRIIKYKNDKNLTEYPNRNKAIDMASGKYLIFIDGDDIIFPHGIAFFVNQLSAFPEAAFAVQKNYFNNLLYPALFQPKETIANVIFGNNLLSSSFASNFFKTELLLKEGKLSAKYKTGDEEVRFRLACKYPVLYIAGWVSWPRETSGQAGSKLQNNIGLFEFCKYFEAILKTRPQAFTDTEFEKISRAKLLKLKTRLVKHLFKKLKWRIAISYMKTLKINWVDLLRNYRINETDIDVLENHSPDCPFKKGFLLREV